MSDSFRKTPISNGRRNSNRYFATRAHRDIRRQAKQAMFHQDPDELQCPEKLMEVSDIWCSHQEYPRKMFGALAWEDDSEHCETIRSWPYYGSEAVRKARIDRERYWTHRSIIKFFCK